jgi:hypothetical protein
MTVIIINSKNDRPKRIAGGVIIFEQNGAEVEWVRFVYYRDESGTVVRGIKK